MNILVLFLILEEMLLAFTSECSVSCGLVIHGLYYVQVWSLYTIFFDSFIKNQC